MNSCKAPQCEFSKRWKKCVKPNPYIEAMSWCKRNRITPRLCKKNYRKDDAQEKACDRYAERIAISNSKSRSKPNSISSVKTNSLHNHIFVRDVYDVAANKISTFIKNNVMQRSENLQKRINYYKSIQYYLKNVPYYNCLTPKKYTDSAGNIHQGFDFDTTLKLIKQIGSDSKFGAVYQTSARSNILSVATKLMPVNRKNKQEIILNNTFTTLVLNKISKHFLLSYRSFKCTKNTPNTPEYPSVIRTKEYYVTLNELAHGDLKMLCHTREFVQNDELLINIAIQCYLSIYTFHILDYCHNDCHWGNFLYHKSKNVTGYFHYIIEGKDYYLKNNGYNIMIYDFGKARTPRVYGYNRRLLEDYLRILYAFLPNSEGGWISIGGLPHNIITRYIDNIGRIVYNITGLGTSVTETDVFTKKILPALLASPIPDIFIDRLPIGHTIVNANTPFYIDRVHCNINMLNPLSSSLSIS